MKKGSILIGEDDNLLLKMQSDALISAGYSVITARTAEEGLQLIKDNRPDILLTDLILPDMNGIELIGEVKSLARGIISIITTAHSSVETVVEAMQRGAFTYHEKPVEIGELLLTIEKAIEIHNIKEENFSLKHSLKSEYRDFILGDSDKIQTVFELIDSVADTDSNILILGESGTGKELVAKGLHSNSSRCDKPFVPINCGAIPEDLLESELFGHVKGAFTGAISSRPGRFEIAEGGTVFLDEIGDMSPKLQVKILRVLQEREFEPVGGVKSKKANVRIIAATHKDLEEAVRDGSFREDLYYRLNVIPIHMPPLRERVEDIQLLVDHFMKRFNREKKRTLKGISPGAMEILMNYKWPGNVRELENLIERLVILKRDGNEVAPCDLPEKIISGEYNLSRGNIDLPPDGLSLRDAVEAFENRLIIQALGRSEWNKNKAATLLGLKRTTLVEKLKKKDIKEPALLN